MEKTIQDFESLKEILREYDPVEEFPKKHEKESDDDFQDWIMK